MKVVIFCGGYGLRLREASERIPKPMIAVGNRPILLHLMKYYAHHGHTDFILCLGYQAQAIKEFFLHYDEALSNDFVLSEGGRSVELLNKDIDNWRITFVDTGLQATVGERLRAVRRHLGDDEMFLANYGDQLSNAPLPDVIDRLRTNGKVASFLAVRPTYSTHVISLNEDDSVAKVDAMDSVGLWINGGFFVMRTEIFDYIEAGEDLVNEPFQRLIDAGKLSAYRYDGFWQPMDTLKDKQVLDGLFETGRAPWAVWDDDPGTVLASELATTSDLAVALDSALS